ncbi:hypothetical protein SynPROS91_00184 [Synechococcus sp. PROS-9-1]|uniref:FkbM family methyltransferase n=1 Tax=Synechococcus sp. PROS-9-1 TaxID=1968775 RepID=UPI00164777EA|nr:FkbM family methyltransferase [Synechococcus sp. PROS-9-1]QNJ30612.1 hypothetical protein SynPROS91_00184 [Synechococcus sp. PROS-9-1]
MYSSWLKRNLLKLCDYRYARHSFSQFGEDLIIEQAFNLLACQKFTYLDIGANHPSRLSNSFYFYRRGSTGVLVEPDPNLYRLLKRKRPRDITLNCGVSVYGTTGKQTLYLMSSNVLNTFSLEEAERIQRTTPFHIVDSIDVDVLPVNSIIDLYFSDIPFFMSIDIEGLDLQILQDINFSLYRPLLIVSETLTFDPATGGRKISEIIEFLISKNYSIFADTRCNTIFVDSLRFQGHV